MSDRTSTITASEAAAIDAQALELAPLLARRELWLLVSVGFVDPFHRQRFELLNNPEFRRRVIRAAALVAEEHPSPELGPGELEPRALSPQDLFAALDAQSNNLETMYRGLFGLTAVSPHCPPCEMEYEPNADVTYHAQQLADVAGFYSAFGLEVSSRAGERLDHITVEAEFLHMLLAKEAFMFAAKDQEGAEVCREARREFFEEHLGWWLPAFSRVILRVAPPGYYRELGRFAAAVSALERTILGIRPFTSRIVPRPTETEVNAACDGCHSAGQA